MHRASRLVVLVALAGLSVTLAGCSSNNTGKIVGKWKFVSGKGFDEQKAELEKMKAYVFMDFKADNTITVGVESSDPDMQKLLTTLAGDKVTQSGKYKLRSGDKIEVYDMPKTADGKGPFQGKDKGQTNCKIDGDKMTMTDPDGASFQLERVK